MTLVAGIVLLALLAVFGVVSGVLSYHWAHYEMDVPRRRRARLTYFTGAGVLLIFLIATFIFIFI